MKISQSNHPNIILAIPSRYGATRLPGKPLIKIAGISMIERVVTSALKLAKSLEGDQNVQVCVMTDDNRIQDVVLSLHGAHCVMTASSIASGTDRILMGLEQLQNTVELQLKPNSIVINIQGDEPFFSHEDISNLIDGMKSHDIAPMGTLVFKATSFEKFIKSSIVKVVLNDKNEAIYFSRAPIPWPRIILGADGHPWETPTPSPQVEFWQHLGVYAFRWSALQNFSRSLKKSLLEETEGLEQLRAVESGWKILAVEALHSSDGIDTEEDVAEAEKKLQQKKD